MPDVIEGRIPEFDELRVGLRESKIVVLGVFIECDECFEQRVTEEYVLGEYGSVKEAIEACNDIYNNYYVDVVVEPEAKELLDDCDEE